MTFPFKDDSANCPFWELLPILLPTPLSGEPTDWGWARVAKEVNQGGDYAVIQTAAH